MKNLIVVLFCAWCGCAFAQTAQELIDNGKGKNSDNVTTFGIWIQPKSIQPAQPDQQIER